MPILSQREVFPCHSWLRPRLLPLSSPGYECINVPVGPDPAWWRESGAEWQHRPALAPQAKWIPSIRHDKSLRFILLYSYATARDFTLSFC